MRLAGVVAWLTWAALSAGGQVFQLPTANSTLFEGGGGDRYFVGTVGKPWTSGTFGCVRSGGRQLHEGIDIRPLQRDKHGEATDPVVATASGTVAYINRRAALSNYGIYVVVRHQVDGLEVYSLYAHLKSVQEGLSAGQPVRAGEALGILGRTANTRQGIDKSRAHLHFELNLFVNDQFSKWFAKHYPGQRDDHRIWNGQNLLGFDPAAVLLKQRAEGASFNLVKFLQASPEFCRVIVRDPSFPWIRRYPALIEDNPGGKKEGVVAYELVLNYVGIPFKVIPRTASEIPKSGRYHLVSVNAEEAVKNSARDLVVKRGGRWELGPSGIRHLDLLTF